MFRMLNACFHIFRKTVESIVVSEGPAVQGIYQQVIREYPDLIGGVWESKRRYGKNDVRVRLIFLWTDYASIHKLMK